MDRRAFVSTVALSFFFFFFAAPQAGRITRIGWLSAGSATIFASRIAAFRQGLREHGYTDESLFIEPRWADGKEELLPVLAAEIIGLKVALLVTVGTPASLAAKQVTETVAHRDDRGQGPRWDRPRQEPGAAGRQLHRHLQPSPRFEPLQLLDLMRAARDPPCRTPPCC